MAQTQRVKTAPTPIEPARPASPAPARSGTSPWVIGALVGVTVALIAVTGWTVYQRYQRERAENLARGAIAAWDAGKPSAFANVYDPKAVVFAADGTRLDGLRAIEDAAAARGQNFSIAPTGGLSVNGDGSYVTASYRYSGHGHGTGVTMLQIANGKVIRQWSYDTQTATPAKK